MWGIRIAGLKIVVQEFLEDTRKFTLKKFLKLLNFLEKKLKK